MSEYQYYEVLALDKPLTDKQLELALRSGDPESAVEQLRPLRVSRPVRARAPVR